MTARTPHSHFCKECNALWNCFDARCNVTGDAGCSPKHRISYPKVIVFEGIPTSYGTQQGQTLYRANSADEEHATRAAHALRMDTARKADEETHSMLASFYKQRRLSLYNKA